MSLKLVRPDWTPRRTHAFVCSLEDRDSDVARVQVVGELRAATAPELARTLHRAERHARLVVLDLRRLTRIDPCGLHVVVAAGIRAQRAGRRLVVVRGLDPGHPGVSLETAPKAVDVIDLPPWKPAVQALLELAREERLARPAA